MLLNQSARHVYEALKSMIEKYEKAIEDLKKEHDSKLKEAQDSNAMFGQGISMIMQRMGVSE